MSSMGGNLKDILVVFGSFGNAELSVDVEGSGRGGVLDDRLRARWRAPSIGIDSPSSSLDVVVDSWIAVDGTI